MLAKVVVDDPSVIRIEWGHFGGFATVNNTFCQMLGFFDEILLLNFAVVIDIHPYARSFPVLGLDDPVNQILYVIEPFAPAANQQVGLAGEDLYRGFISRCVEFDFSDKSQISEHCVENFAGNFISFHGQVKFPAMIAILAFGINSFFSSSWYDVVPCLPEFSVVSVVFSELQLALPDGP